MIVVRAFQTDVSAGCCIPEAVPPHGNHAARGAGGTNILQLSAIWLYIMQLIHVGIRRHPMLLLGFNV
jgi:hypothetical protein